MTNNALEKRRKDELALEVERRLMNEALGRLQRIERNRGIDRPLGRLIFGLDLTGSREPSLRRARIATAAMFDTIKAIGAVSVKLIYYRGTTECMALPWQNDPAIVSRAMLALSCESGETQIARLLRAALAEERAISGVVFVGDHCEDDRGELFRLAQTFGQKSVPLFMFHECADDNERSLEAKPIFKRMAELSGGVYTEFKPDSGLILRELLSNVAAFSLSGYEGLKEIGQAATPEARQLRGSLLMLPAGNPKQLR